MECLYDDLFNYEDVRTLEELRAKNKELKVKLEEHSAAKEKLQKDNEVTLKALTKGLSTQIIKIKKKDYDNLKIEFKKLESNYSSMLTTARSELQSKTQMITTITLERKAPVLPVKDEKLAAYFFCKYNRNKLDNIEVNLELSNERKRNVNDNIAQHKTELKEPPKTTASSITDRRKSTLTVRQHRKRPDYPSQKCGSYQGSSLESPPPETPSNSRHQPTKAAQQSDCHRYPHEQEKSRYYHGDKCSAQYRSKDYGTLIKRQRTQSYEIMANATPLGDPRVTSNRYVIRKENGKEVLTTVVGRNIDIKPVNKVKWNIMPVDIPVALLRRPSQCSDQLAKEIYIDINNPVTNLGESMVSGEVRRTSDVINEISSKVKKSHHNTQDPKISKQPPAEISKQPANAESVSKPNIKKYRIRKIRQSNKNTHSKIGVPIIDLAENVPQLMNVNVNRKGEAEDSVPKEFLPHIQQYNNCKDFVLEESFCGSSKLHCHKKSKSRKRSETQYQSTLTGIAGHLELSEDTSDQMNTNIRVVPEKVQKHCEIPLIMNEVRSKDSINSVENKSVASSHNTEIKSTDSTKIQKTKNKQSKSKEIFKGSVENTGELIHVHEKKRKSKKEKKSISKETKQKFIDLFGDCSFITPEDWGIPISKDVQEDMKIYQIAAPPVYKDEIPVHIPHPNRVEVTKQKTAVHDDIPKADLNNNNDIKENKISSKTLTYAKLPSPIVYENLYAGTDLNDPNVVIISTGTQPEIEYENKTHTTQNTKDIHLLPATKKFKKDILKAFATFTPHKEYSAMNPLEADAAKTDVICDPCVSQSVVTITNLDPIVNQTEKNTLESNDEPDVRIIMKSRRKVVKRPPTTHVIETRFKNEV